MAKMDLAAALAEPVEEEEEAGDLEMVAEDLIAAVKAGDAAGVAAAMKAGHEICQAEYGAEEEV